MPKNQEENPIKPTQPEESAPQETPQEAPQEEKKPHKGLFKNERVNFIIGVILIIFSIYLTISFISFLFTGSVDQSKIENLSIGELSSVSNDIQNWTGAFGAYLSNLMINRWMGISAFIVALWLYVVGRRFIRVSHTRMIRFTITCALSIIVLSLFFGFIFLHSYQGTFLYLGGYHGYYATQWLNAWIGPWGTALFIAALAIILLVHLSYKTIDYIRRASSVNLTGRAIQSIRKKADQWANSGDHDKPEKEDDEKEITVTPEDTVPETAQTEPTPDEMSQTDIKPEDTLAASEMDDITAGYPDDLVEPLPSPDELEEPAPHDHEETKRLTIDTGDPSFVIETAETDEMTTQAPPLEDYDPTKDLSHYKRPTFDLLDKRESSEVEINMEEQAANKKLITETLKNYNIGISSITATVGPTVTLYEIKPEAGVRIARIKNLENDIALSLSALGIRIIAPIPGKGTVGIEVPNKEPKMVSMYSVLASRKFQECKYDLPLALGKSITNEVFIADLCKMPHILVAGATGQGKSVGLNAIITSLLYKKHPAQLKFVLVDPKMVEFSIYSVIEKHFMAKLPDAEKAVITDSDKVIATLNSLCIEMDNRYALLAKANVRTIKEYNDEFIHRRLNPNNGHKFMPYIVVVIDEFADLIMMAGRDVEMPIARIAQKARAVGIHMVIATQRPSTTVITGNIKANFPARIAFRVMQMVDSRTILDAPGANQLIGRGDMLFTEGGELKRIQCAFIDTPEVKRICEYISHQQGYPEAYELPEYKNENSDSGSGADMSNRDPLFEEAAKMIVVSGQASTSSLQRRYSIGYNRAGRLMDQLEAAGIVGPSEGGKPRQVLISDIMALENKLDLMK
ncbi:MULTISPECIES: DNA translocase FtsK [unclassified Barnesiella]|uniref:FtsK/SpoIIIE family DNA translocase n=1 Tax=unclassified Barnesiella TaxID=2645177 RepID=UPI000B3726FC|nr:MULTISPECIES: DNA translocase FtsK [unclassified Barnesiella]MCR8911139.1 DNA translocase FtsK [Barnesiella sp. ET7]OUO99641.1 cell division protein FtsK [Barnesiella sp. An22]